LCFEGSIATGKQERYVIAINKTETLSSRRKLEGKEKTKFSSLSLSSEDYWDLWPKVVDYEEVRTSGTWLTT
jgi:hypothetical protein